MKLRKKPIKTQTLKLFLEKVAFNNIGASVSCSSNKKINTITITIYNTERHLAI